MGEQVYWRMHWVTSPEFSAENAYSAPWGADGCYACDGTGEAFDKDGECDMCDGTGDLQLDRGYSCCYDLDALRHYFSSRSIPADEDGEVIMFQGTEVGKGPDLEPLVVPTIVLRRIPASAAFKKSTKER